MTFNSMEELKNYILSKSQSAVRVAQEEVYGIIHKFVKQYYSEYDPSVYERTYQLLRSLVKTDVISTGNGWEAQIYFDIGALDYTIKTFTKPSYYWDGVYHSPLHHRMECFQILKVLAKKQCNLPRMVNMAVKPVALPYGMSR